MYIQDSIKLRSNLTVSLGLRHELTNGWNEVACRASNYLFDASGLLITQPRVGCSYLTENNSKWLFAPRTAIAWDPFTNGKTAIRAGFGLYYSLIKAVINK